MGLVWNVTGLKRGPLIRLIPNELPKETDDSTPLTENVKKPDAENIIEKIEKTASLRQEIIKKEIRELRKRLTQNEEPVN